MSGTTTLDRAVLRRRVLALSAALWLLEIIYLEVRRLVLPPETFPVETLYLARLIWVGTGLGLGMGVYYLVERILDRSFVTVAGVLALLALTVGGLHSFATRALFDWMLDIESGAAGTFLTVTFWFNFHLAWATLVLALIYSSEVARVQRERTRAEELARIAEMQTLRYQLNPHFLFNTLNSVAALVIEGKGETAERMIGKLADFLRAGLATEGLADTPLASEIEQQIAYLEIECTRFPERLAIETRIGEGLSQALVPAFILQPLVENAIKHGVGQSNDKVTIMLCAQREGERLTLEVSDDGRPLAAADRHRGTGTGLRNIRERLQARYGEDFELEAGPRPEGGFRVRMTIPLEWNAP